MSNNTVEKKILDACCGGRMAWYQKEHEDTIYMDNRRLTERLSNGQTLNVQPDVIGDFRDMKFEDSTFSLVLFDPPHLRGVGKNSWLAKKYGVLDNDTWHEDLKKGFDECMRVLKPGGTLIVKWSIDKSHPSRSVKITDFVKLLGADPLFGDRPMSGKSTYWLVYMKF